MGGLEGGILRASEEEKEGVGFLFKNDGGRYGTLLIKLWGPSVA
jgi:hypothetical protein